MPPTSTTLSDEGACIESFFVVRKGVFNGEELRRLLVDVPAEAAGSSGCRSFSDVQSDLKAVGFLSLSLPLTLSGFSTIRAHFPFCFRSSSSANLRQPQRSSADWEAHPGLLSSSRSGVHGEFTPFPSPLPIRALFQAEIELTRGSLSFSRRVTSERTLSLEFELSLERLRRSWVVFLRRRISWMMDLQWVSSLLLDFEHVCSPLL